MAGSFVLAIAVPALYIMKLVPVKPRKDPGFRNTLNRSAIRGSGEARRGIRLLGIIRERLLRRRFGTPIIVVSGLPRSGTSMMMKMLDAGGAEIVTDNIRAADEDNPKGYFELEQVKDLDKDGDRSWLRDCRGKAIKIISFLLEGLPEDNYYKVLFMRRDLDEVMASQNKMLVRRGEPTDESKDAGLMERYRFHLRRIGIVLEEMDHFGFLDVDYRDVLESPADWAARVRRFVGLPLDVDAMTAVVDKSLYRNRRRT
jgi:hypothetical protein